MRRLMEDENAKRRKALRRHYNETVRELATFVRKRDKRVLSHMVCTPLPPPPPPPPPARLEAYCFLPTCIFKVEPVRTAVHVCY